MHSSWNYYSLSKLELIELPKMKTHYGINSSSICKYITNFCTLSHFQRIMIPGIASNLEAYIAQQMLTAYINNAEMRSGTHPRSCLNLFFDVRALRSTF